MHRVCLAASGGGHLRQMLDLEPFWRKHDYYFVTEPTALSETLAKKHPVRTVPHFAYGQGRLSGVFALIASGIGNLIASWRYVREMRPDIVVSTGAGSAFFTVVFARLFGARFILVETFARFERPSLFGRLAKPFAYVAIVQSVKLLDDWEDAEPCNPLRLYPPSSDPKEDLGFVTVGTVMPFDRLVNAVAALTPEQGRPARIIAQVGKGGARPASFDEVHETIDFGEIQGILKRASVVFCHGGSGSILTAASQGCRIVAMPRRADLREHYDDHQREIVDAFADKGILHAADGADDLPATLACALAAHPQRAALDFTAVVELLDYYTKALERGRRVTA